MGGRSRLTIWGTSPDTPPAPGNGGGLVIHHHGVIVMQHEGYMVLVRPLSEDDGGGYVATVPYLPGCMADGETAEAALIAARDAIDAWMEAAKAEGRSIPKPGSGVA